MLSSISALPVLMGSLEALATHSVISRERRPPAMRASFDMSMPVMTGDFQAAVRASQTLTVYQQSPQPESAIWGAGSAQSSTALTTASPRGA